MKTLPERIVRHPARPQKTCRVGHSPRPPRCAGNGESRALGAGPRRASRALARATPSTPLTTMVRRPQPAAEPDHVEGRLTS